MGKWAWSNVMFARKLKAKRSSWFPNSIASKSMLGGKWKHIMGGQKLLSHCIVFKDPMFELQPWNYYEGFSQCFCILW